MRLTKLLLVPIAFVLLSLSACSGSDAPSAEALLAAKCAGYSSTLNAMQPLKPRMSESQVATVKDVIEVVGPICRRAADLGMQQVEFDAGTMADLVSTGLTSLARVQSEVSN